MGMNVDAGGKGGRKKVVPDMNVTPLVDVVLVLLIIFMVLAPVVTKGFWVRLPPKDDKDKQLEEQVDPDAPLILHIDEEGELDVNGVELDPKDLSERLHRMFNARPNNVLYIDGEDVTPYGAVVSAINGARKGGAKPLVVLTKALD